MPTAIPDPSTHEHGANIFQALLKSLDDLLLVSSASFLKSFPLKFHLFADSRSVPRNGIALINFEIDPDTLDELIDAMGVAANGTRTDETGSLKLTGLLTGLDYVLMGPSRDKIEPSPRTGFLCGHTRVQTWRHIFTGLPLHLTRPGELRNPPKAAYMASKSRISAILCTAAVQIYFTLSNEESWTTVTGTVDLTD
ncbi:hypothetical protein BU15DRAFT_60240, partial [Melanogaster broomeanus]